jgi:hypothetical protein
MKAEGMYVYQYDGKLYWIATKDYTFDESGSTYIRYQLHTSQINKLPSESIQNKFDNLDFYFEQQEYKEENTVPYRVVIHDIPDDYIITYINTGAYDTVNDVWKWEKCFHIEDSISGQ